MDANGCAVDELNGAGNAYDFLSVMFHEVGHAIGIAHPHNRCDPADECYPESMNACTDAEEFMRRALNQGDKDAIAANYPN